MPHHKNEKKTHAKSLMGRSSPVLIIKMKRKIADRELEFD
jgi:hypothetical protein